MESLFPQGVARIVPDSFALYAWKAHRWKHIRSVLVSCVFSVSKDELNGLIFEHRFGAAGEMNRLRVA